MLSCKGVCKTKYREFLGDSKLKYNGQKRCGACDIYLRYDDIKCPCCKSILHVRPRHSRAKTKYYESHGTQWI
jgi:hydrogenase nickel incorporation protein HypA/HybF